MILGNLLATRYCEDDNFFTIRISSRCTNVRGSLKRFAKLDLTKGILNLVHPFYKNNPIELRLGWLQWYDEKELTYIDNIPNDPPRAGNLITDNIQGVAHDNDNWYFTSYAVDIQSLSSGILKNRGIVWKIPLTKI
jgi:hypothetical protein